MKKLLAGVFFLIAVLMSCAKKSDRPSVPAMPPGTTTGNDTNNALMPIYRGTLTTGAEGTVMGISKVYFKDNAYSLALDSFSVSSGPDLHVYLAKEATPIHFIDLGKLHSITGKQFYAINGAPDFAVYKYTVIHCQQYNVVFGSAELK